MKGNIMFKSQTYLERRNKLKKRIDSGIALFLGNDESPMNYKDNPYHYRQDSTFLYYFGLNIAGLSGVIDFDEDKDSTVFLSALKKVAKAKGCTHINN